MKELASIPGVAPDDGALKEALAAIRDDRVELPTAPLVNDWIASNLPADQIGKISALANEVFGDEPVATAWLREPNLAMDNKPPISLLGTQLGFDRVKNLLLRIRYGVLA